MMFPNIRCNGRFGAEVGYPILLNGMDIIDIYVENRGELYCLVAKMRDNERVLIRGYGSLHECAAQMEIIGRGTPGYIDYMNLGEN